MPGMRKSTRRIHFLTNGDEVNAFVMENGLMGEITLSGLKSVLVHLVRLTLNPLHARNACRSSPHPLHQALLSIRTERSDDEREDRAPHFMPMRCMLCGGGQNV